METEQPRRRWGDVRYVVLIVLLLIATAVLAAVMVDMLRKTPAGGARARYYFHMALVCLAMLGIVLVTLGWMLARFAAHRTQAVKRDEPTRYADAWSASGKRFQLQKRKDEEDESEEGSQ